jgi:hypothetical protein
MLNLVARAVLGLYVAGLVGIVVALAGLVIIAVSCRGSDCGGPFLGALVLMIYGVIASIVLFPFAYAAMKYIERQRKRAA